MDTMTFEVIKVKMKQEFPGLITLDAEYSSDSLTVAAKNIRIELKAAFPGVKFRVRTERYSGGDSINVKWIDGPTRAQVEEIIKKYQGGHFDGMTDYYEYSNSAFNEVFGDAKYVFADREISDSLAVKAIFIVAAKFGAEPLDVAEYRKGGAYRWTSKGGFPLDREINVTLSELAA